MSVSIALHDITSYMNDPLNDPSPNISLATGNLSREGKTSVKGTYSQ